MPVARVRPSGSFVLAALVGAVGCSGATATAPTSAPVFAGEPSLSLHGGFVSCPRYGFPQTDPNCMQIKPLGSDLAILALAEASRLQAEYGVGSDCYSMGSRLQGLVQSGRVFEVPYRFAGSAGSGTFGHLHQQAGLPDEMHISRGVDVLNTRRPDGALLDTFTHESGHSMGMAPGRLDGYLDESVACGNGRRGGGAGGGLKTRRRPRCPVRARE